MKTLSVFLTEASNPRGLMKWSPLRYKISGNEKIAQEPDFHGGPVAKSMRDNPQHGDYHFKSNDVHDVRWHIHHKGNKVGHFIMLERKKKVLFSSIAVHRDHMRQGHATAAYDYLEHHAKKFGKQVVPSGNHSQRGAIMWKNRFDKKHGKIIAKWKKWKHQL